MTDRSILFSAPMVRALIAGVDYSVTEWSYLLGVIHGDGAWALNPWVVAYTFRTILANIDAPEAQAI